MRKPTKAVERLIGAGLFCFLVLQFAAAAMLLVLINMIAGASIGYLPRGFGALTGAMVLMVLAVLLAPIPVLGIGRFFASPRTLDEFIARDIDFARWQGRCPSRWSWPDKAFAAAARFAIRVLRITPPAPLQPELRHGATLELAEKAGAWS